MKRKSLFLTAVLILTLATSALTQDKKKDVTETKNLIIKLDKFRDRTIVATKPVNIYFKYGREGFICNMIAGYLIDENKKPSSLFMYISPGGVGFGVAFAESLARSSGANTGAVYFPPDADVIILVGEEKHKLGRVSKDFGLQPNGDLKSSIAIELPLDTLKALSTAEKWEMAVGSLEAKMEKRQTGQTRNRFAELQARYATDTNTSR